MTDDGRGAGATTAQPGGEGETGDLNATFCAAFVDELVRSGVTDAVVCPGSRSTPMALAIDGDERLRVHVHHDERSAAFLALGLGRATGRPAPVLTTSGTAAVELHPAVVEADLDRVPLLVLTADRPPEKRDVGAAQTIDQTHLYGRSVRWFADPGPPSWEAADSWRSLASRAVLEAGRPHPGPVQVNLPFREPLVGRPGPLPPGRDSGRPWHRMAAPSPASGDQAGATREALAGAERGVIVAGGDIDDPDAVLALADAWGWPVLADPRSGCRTGHRAAIAHADALLRSAAVGDEVDAVVRLGSVPASKVQAQWLARLDVPQVVVDRDGAWFDPDRTAGLLVPAAPGAWARAMLALGSRSTSPGWGQRWRRADDAVEAVLVDALDGDGSLTEPGTARVVAGSLPAGGALVVSSSMPVRDLEWFAGPIPGVAVHANRGANGIDGVVSTAVGVALAGAPTALLIGDIALLHDTNGLLGAARRDIDLCVVVVDNGGGGIFSFLPQASAVAPERFEALFATPHGVDLAALVRAHGIPATTIDRVAELGPAVAGAVAQGGVHVVLVTTDRAANVELHDHLHRLTADAISDLP
ncbi:2-succinyl-5-enolpyruvyl-6-hydroxy-3-cyclohexene-1-carboxylic-acid synthase [Rhabdothermincola salaria]|uniref:2-succinyl-5-enolpyruvyl-6-hydroxy-3- cyclohexene-1-carboxylic-acid synthase n=1 Tax=Rhabdothermincola salaria TaxID=2903142 RepID=UPI001E40CCD3|nr:2-succinyl-5-enolpyruvyl-6-hydroxy-3-cyclohexene-1-carboxylic-acid synthase [Rhabdothermincola salaria]